MIILMHGMNATSNYGDGKMSNSGLCLGIDLGGTKILAIITDQNNKIVAECKSATDISGGIEQIAADVVATGESALKQLQIQASELDGIGIAIPSPVDPVTGDCLMAPNLGLKNFSMKTLFSQAFGVPIYLGNDGNLGILGEHSCGAAKGFCNVIGYYVGTGLGGGMILNNRLYSGNSGLAGEFGHVTVRHGGRRCGCGHKGCAEPYCSKVAFVKGMKKEIFKHGARTTLPLDKFSSQTKNIKSKLLAKAYNSGDPTVCKVVNKGAYMLGVSAASACAVVAPECIILGGGVIEALGVEIFPIFKASFDSHLFGLDPSKIQIRITALGDHAVALGATVLARTKGDC